MVAQLITELFIFIIGASIGSFLNVLIDRLPKEEKIDGRSHCDFCRKKIAAYDLIPVISFFVLRGKSRCCNKKLSWQYPLIELITGLFFVLIYNQFSKDWLLLVGLLGIISSLIVIFVSDFKYNLISDYLQVAFFIFSLVFHLSNSDQFQLILTNFLPSGLIVALPIWLIYFFSREKAMGLGDAFLAANVGFLLGLQTGFLALYVAFVTGAIFGLLLIFLRRKKFNSQVPFGPFIIIGTVIIMFWGEKIMEIIKNIYRF